MAAKEMQDTEHDDIAIIGMACRYPGDESTLEGFWDTIANARSAHSHVPDDRWKADAFHHPSSDRAGAVSTKGGYFLKEDIGAFDAGFFSITANESAGTDPMQRLLLELAYEAFENAGIPMDQLTGSNTGCYVGCFTKDYEDVASRDIYDVNQYTSTGNGRSMLSNRISWFYDLAGPSMTIDTACSSSMYAFHLACQSIKLGEIDQAIVGGCNIILSPDVMRTLSAMRFLSPDGKCHSFDHRANGYARGEGIGTIMIKRLSKAIEDGDTIRSIVRASGLNQDGKTPGITMPSAKAQASLIRSCYAQADIDMDETSYFEAHGTGTLLGDPIELSAIGATFGSTGRDPVQNPLFVSSVKTNIGHQEGGAGLAGIIRTTMALERGLIPPLADFQRPNPMLKLEQWKIRLPTRIMAWPRPGVRRASINSFGYGGANSHVILDDAYHYMESRGLKGKHNTCARHISQSEIDLEGNGPMNSGSSSAVATTNKLGEDYRTSSARRKLYVFSAVDTAALSRTLFVQANHLEKRLNATKQLTSEVSDPRVFMDDLAFTLAHHRTIFEHRIAVAAGNAAELLTELRTHSAQHKSKKINRSHNIAFVFTGQGAQWAGMGKELLSLSSIRESLSAAQSTLRRLGCSWDLMEELLRDEDSNINLPSFSQPICTAFQLAQVDLLRSWGIRPKAVVGHSSGEIAAAYAAGFLSHEDAVTIAYYRGFFSSKVSTITSGSPGAMMAVGLSQNDATPYLAHVAVGSVVIACVNSPSSVTLSGDASEIDALELIFKRNDVFARKLNTSNTAYHSHHMRVISNDYLHSMRHVTPLEDQEATQMFSSVAPGLVVPSSLGASYWVKNMLMPVRFSEALHSLLVYNDNGRKRRRAGQEYTAIVEIGPHGALKGPIMQILAAEDPKTINLQNLVYQSMLVRKVDAEKSTLDMVGHLWSQGYPLDFQLINQEDLEKTERQILVDLPAYPWNHSRRMWHHTAMSVSHTKDPRTDLLGVMHGLVDTGAPYWRNIIRLAETPWLADHKVHTAVIYPAASMITMALEAAQKLAQPGRKIKGYLMRDICLPRALMVPTDGGKQEISLRIVPRRAGSKSMGSTAFYDFSLSSLTGATWTEHCMGIFTIQYEEDTSEVDGGREYAASWTENTATYRNLKLDLTTKLQKQQFYKRSHAMGLCYGPSFQGVEECHYGTNKCHSVVVIPDTKSVSPQQFEFDHLIHPTTLDSILQTLLGCLVEGPKTSATFVPIGIGSLFIAADLPKGAGSKFVGFSYSDGLRPGQSQELLGQIVMSDESWTEPKVVVTDFASIAISQVMTGAQEESGARRKCTQMHWSEDLRYSMPTVSPMVDMLRSQTCSGVLRRIMTTIMENVQEETRLSPHMQEWLAWAQRTIPAIETSDKAPVDSAQESLVIECSDFQDRLSDLLRRGKDASEALTDGLRDCIRAVTRRPSYSPLLEPWLSAMYHNDPNASILLIGDGDIDSAAMYVARAYGSRAGRDTSFKNLIFAETSDEALKSSSYTLKIERMQLQYKTINSACDLTEQGFDEKSIDLVVAPPSLRNLVPSFARIMRHGGHLFVTGRMSVPEPIRFFSGLSASWWAGHPVQHDSKQEQFDWLQELRIAGFQPLDAPNVLIDSEVFIMPAKNHVESSELPTRKESIVLLRSLQQSEDVNMLESQLLKHLAHLGIEVHITTLQVASGKTNQVPCVETPPKANSSAVSIDTLEDRDESGSESDIRTPDSELSSCVQSTLSSEEGFFHRPVGTTPIESTEEAKKTPMNPAISKHIHGKIVLSLVELSENYIANLTADTLAALKAVALQSSAFLWVTRGAQPVASDFLNLDQGISTGLLRTIRSEVPQTLSVHLDVSTNEDLASQRTSNLIFDVLKTEILATHDSSNRTGHDRELAIHEGKVFVPRVIWDNSIDEQLQIPDKVESPQPENLIQENRPLRLTVGTKGRLDSLHWVDDDTTLKPLEPLEMDVEAAAWSINFVDVMNAMGQIPSGSNDLGFEAAGKVLRVGSQVTDIIPGQLVVFPKNPAAACSIVRINSEVVYPVPDGWSLSEAVSCPVIYTTAYSALIDSARLAKGETVLIHAAAGGLGQAAIQIAQWLGAEVYATVGTQAKKALLMEQYGIPDDHIFSSRDLTFVASVMRATKNKGVDVILNSLAGEALRQSWNSIASFGRFIEVGKADIIQNTGLDMAPFMRHATFACVNVDHLWHIGKSRFVDLWAKTHKLLASGVLRPVSPITVYSPAEVEKAFRMMQTGKHSGKVVIAVSEDAQANVVPVLPRKPAEVELDDKATYVLCGGFGGIGRSCAKMMVAHGARHLVFLSRSGASTPQAQSLVRGLQSKGVKVDDVKCDSTDPGQVRDFWTRCKIDGWNVRGLIQCAMVLRDKAIENLTFDEWSDVIRSKVNGTRNLHDILPKRLDFFIMLSSLSGVLGHPGQANYCAANTYIDSLANYRRANGWAATAIDLGVVSDVGYFAENPEQFDKFDHLSAIHINEQDLHQLLNCCMANATADGKQIPAQVIAGFGKEILQNPTMGTTWDKDRKFLHATSSDSTGPSVGAENELLRASIANAETIKDAGKEIEGAVLQRLSKSLMMAASDIDASKPMHSYGVDSLVAVEIRNWTFRELESDITVFDILAPMPISLLALKIASKSKLISEILLKEQLEEVNKELSQAESQATL